jgi:hypothetical protein
MRFYLIGIVFLIGLCFSQNPLFSQRRSEPRPFHIQHNFKNPNSFFQNDTTLNLKRKKRITGIALGGYGVSMLYLGTQWYADEELGRFRFFRDIHEWKQIDKGGHMLGGYSSSRWITGLYRWAGVEKRKAVIAGGISGFLAMSSIEVFDGFGETWGFSWSDVGANFIGSSLAVGNQLLWNEERLQLKVSYRRSAYAQNPDFHRLFGSNYAEWILKDYNGHTIWLSARVHSFLPEGRFKDVYPPWLNLAVGYGAEGLEGGYDDPLQAYKLREYRQFYLSFDIDLTQIKTRNGFLHTLFQVVNVIRIPMPAIRFDQTGVRLRAFE